MARKYQQGSDTGIRVLVVDDSVEVLESTRMLLHNEGHEVFTASSAKLALEFLARERVHVMVVDYFMPAMTGEDLVREVRAHGDQLTQIILATGYSGEKPARVMMRTLDIQGYHDKSEGAEKLLLWIDNAVKTHRHMLAMEKHRKGLRFILDITPELHRMQPIDELLEGLLWQLEALLGAENSFVATLNTPADARAENGSNECFIALTDSHGHASELQIRAGTGRFTPGAALRTLSPSVASLVDKALASRVPHSESEYSVVPLVLGRRSIGVIYLDRRTGYAKDRDILEIFASQAAAAIQNALLYDMATTDPLTGSYLRASAMQQLESALKRSLRRGEPLSLLMIDLDKFKGINDLHGHQAGDKALAAVGDLLRFGLRDSDIVGRYGGDEFIVILPETSPAGAKICAERLLSRAASLEIETRGHSVPVRLSVGIGTLMPADREEATVERERLYRAVEKLIGSADRALYAAKGTGRPGEQPVLRWVEMPEGMQAA